MFGFFVCHCTVRTVLTFPSRSQMRCVFLWFARDQMMDAVLMFDIGIEFNVPVSLRCVAAAAVVMNSVTTSTLRSLTS